MTPAVTLEQKKQAVASPLSTLSLLSNKDGVRLHRRSGRQKATFESRPWRRNMAGTYRGCQIPPGLKLFMHKQNNIKYVFFIMFFYLLYLIYHTFISVWFFATAVTSILIFIRYTHTHLFHDAFIYRTHIQERMDTHIVGLQVTIILFSNNLTIVF